MSDQQAHLDGWEVLGLEWPPIPARPHLIGDYSGVAGINLETRIWVV